MTVQVNVINALLVNNVGAINQMDSNIVLHDSLNLLYQLVIFVKV